MAVATGRPAAAGRRPWRVDGPVAAVAVAALAALVVGAGLALGWRGVDLPAQLYRVELFHRHGFALWDSQWYGGHWLLDYSVLFPALAATVGISTVTVVSAVAATAAFDRLVVDRFGPAARTASVAFALGTTAQAAIGQLPFLLGEAAGLCCLVLVARRHWWPAASLAALASLVSPLAGAFVALAVVASWVGRPRPAGESVMTVRSAAGPLGVVVGAAAPVAVTAVLFPGQGPMPYPFVDFAWELAVAAGLWLIVPAAARTLRLGLLLYALCLLASEVVATPLGGNVGRLEDVAALPVAVAVLWPGRPGTRRPSGRRLAVGRRRGLLALVAVPLALSQWAPAWAAMTSNDGQPWTHAAYYRPVVAWLAAQPGPAGRVEVVPTADHWEAAYVAPALPLARGWERQLDRADNPIFYRRGAPTAGAYLEWLVANGVRYVARADAPLDAAGTAEAALLDHGVPGVVPVWQTAGWRVYRVTAGAGIVGPGARLLHLDGGQLRVAVDRPGPVLVRVRWSSGWTVVEGAATLAEAPGRWLQVRAAAAGVVVLRLGVL